MRLAAGVEYQGTGFAGWQSQPHASSVQAEVEHALSMVADCPIKVICAGRTDAGVHGVGQVIHFDTTASRPPQAWVFGANAHLPASVSLRWVKPVPDDFHARYNARSRRYRYLIHNSRTRTALFADRACWYTYPLDAGRMQEAARHLVGEHDFSSYRATECQAKSPIRNVREISVERRNNWVMIDVEANAFLHHMVRNIAGVLMMIGRGVQEPGWTKDILLARDRRAGGVTADAEGLYLLLVRYDALYGIPAPDLSASMMLP